MKNKKEEEESLLRINLIHLFAFEVLLQALSIDFVSLKLI